MKQQDFILTQILVRDSPALGEDRLYGLHAIWRENDILLLREGGTRHHGGLGLRLLKDKNTSTYRKIKLRFESISYDHFVHWPTQC
jgi:hypothetical protein